MTLEDFDFWNNFTCNQKRFLEPSLIFYLKNAINLVLVLQSRKSEMQWQLK